LEARLLGFCTCLTGVGGIVLDVEAAADLVFERVLIVCKNPLLCLKLQGGAARKRISNSELVAELILITWEAAYQASTNNGVFLNF
jgi:hypothetical protein